jgi:hypothetical protein
MKSGPGVVVGEVEALADLAAADGDEEGAVGLPFADGPVRGHLYYLGSMLWF